MRPRAAWLALLAIQGCGAKSQLRSGGGGAPDASASDPDAAAPDAALPQACSASPECPAARVYCDAEPPVCPPGTYAGVEPALCEGGHCIGRCWTGACLPCADECECDEDCALVDRFGCCCEDPDGPDVGDARIWALPLRELAADPCKFAGDRPGDPPGGCSLECEAGPVECGGVCSHCPAHGARCEGGRCVPTRDCEPDCACF
jgi:hypothetical protein